MKLFRLVTCLAFLLVLNPLPSLAGQKIQSLCQFHYPSDYLYEWDCVRLTNKDTPYKVFGKLWQDGLRFNRMDRRHFVAGVSIKVPRRLQEIKGFNPMPTSYPEAADYPRFILIDQNEMYLGAYERGTLMFSAPVAVGVEGLRLGNGRYRVDAVDRTHASSLYPMEGKDLPYPMHYALRVYIEKRGEGWTTYWMHGRDLPGYPASHGCIGLYDEEMQKQFYHEPGKPVLMDAKKLYRWVLAGQRDSGKLQGLRSGPIVVIVGEPPGGAESQVAGAAAPPKSPVVQTTSALKTPLTATPLPSPPPHAARPLAVPANGHQGEKK